VFSLQGENAGMRMKREQLAGAQGGEDVRRYRESAESDRIAPDDMKIVRPKMTVAAGAAPRRTPLVAAVGPRTASRTLRVEPLMRRAPGAALPRD
jgi:hypothetical protein